MNVLNNSSYNNANGIHLIMNIFFCKELVVMNNIYNSSIKIITLEFADHHVPAASYKNHSSTSV